MKIFAIIPALNEFQKLGEVIQKTRGYVDEVVVVDDGSQRPLRNELPAIEGLSVLRHSINLGKGAALKTGVVFAQQRGADAVVFLDADGQHAAEDIPALLEPITSNRADIVFGVRKFHEHMPLVARLGNIFLTTVITRLFGIRVSDSQSGFRSLRLSAYPKLIWESPRYAVETEMIVNAGKGGLRFVEVPIQTIYLDKYRGTTVIDGLRIFWNILRWRLQ